MNCIKIYNYHETNTKIINFSHPLNNLPSQIVNLKIGLILIHQISIYM